MAVDIWGTANIQRWLNSGADRTLQKRSTAPCIPRRSPIQVLTRLVVALLQWSDENWCFQRDMAVDILYGWKLKLYWTGHSHQIWAHSQGEGMISLSFWTWLEFLVWPLTASQTEMRNLRIWVLTLGKTTKPWSGKSVWDLVNGTLFMTCRAGSEGRQKSVHQRGNGIDWEKS